MNLQTGLVHASQTKLAVSPPWVDMQPWHVQVQEELQGHAMGQGSRGALEPHHPHHYHPGVPAGDQDLRHCGAQGSRWEPAACLLLPSVWHTCLCCCVQKAATKKLCPCHSWIPMLGSVQHSEWCMRAWRCHACIHTQLWNDSQCMSSMSSRPCSRPRMAQASVSTECPEHGAGLDVRAVARRATECYLTQVLTHGFLHSDPHPGNIAINPQGVPSRQGIGGVWICLLRCPLSR